MSVIALQITPIRQPKPASRTRSFGPLSIWYARYRYRLMLRDDLLTQPDSVLADAGISRTAAKREAQKPFWRA